MNQQPIKKAPHAAECFCSDCTLRKGGLQDEPASHADENGSLEPKLRPSRKNLRHKLPRTGRMRPLPTRKPKTLSSPRVLAPAQHVRN